jgi:DNA replication and repair protein RecF
MTSIFESNYRIDIASQRTTEGIHKDDLEFNIHEITIKKYGSQGQIKSFIVALKIAQYEYLKSKTGKKPILLLDDIFEKIDDQRSKQLMKMVCSDHFGQIFVSDTNLQRVQEHFEDQKMQCTFIEI